MDFEKFSCARDDDGKRLDTLTKILLKNLPLSHVYVSIRKGFILVNQKRTKPNSVLHAGDTISVAEFLLSEKKIQNENVSHQNLKTENIENENRCIKNSRDKKFPFKKIFENENALIISKPYDVSVQKDIAPFMQNHYENPSISFRASPVHRLDKKTTGILCIAKTLSFARFLSSAFVNHAVTKKYLSLVEGEMKTPCEWRDEISRVKTKTDNFYTNKKKAPANEKKTLAVTRAFPAAKGIYNGKKITLVLFSLETGLHHQIRFQASIHGFPLLGDSAYGAKKIALPPGFFLHAFFLQIPKNDFNVPEKIFDAPSETFLAACNVCNIDLKKIDLKKNTGSAQ